ncbi:hypothetical protein BGZ93_000468 [Podila epicladia]|nr:hypothetical protein BGZ93_000468 [Podila epicladia]
MHPVPSSGAPQFVVGLGLSLQYGNKVPTAKTEIAIVLRHKDYRRCPTQCEELPDFTDPEVWPRNKLLRSSTSTQAVQRELQSNLCSKLSKDIGIDTNSIQQIGRLSGAEELAVLDLNPDFPARIAPNGVDIYGTVAMAGFHNTQYDNRRDRVIPPKSLQRRIFPGIEEQYGWMVPEEWKAHCDRVMMSPTAFLGLEGSPGTEMKRRLDAVQESEEAYQDVAKLQLMHLLLWLRRVVLQDAVLFKRDRFSPWIVKDPVFHSAEFNNFRADLLAKMGSDDGENPTNVRGQEDFPVSDIPSMGAKSEHSDHGTADELSDHDTNSDLSVPNSASLSTGLNDETSRTLDDETAIHQQTQSDQAQLQLQIQQLQERLDQQEQLRRQQEQCLQDQTTLLRNVFEQQSSLELQMKTIQINIQNQIQIMQTELAAQQDSQFGTLVVLLQGIVAARSPSSNPPDVSDDVHISDSSNAGTTPISKAVSDLAVATDPTPAQGILETEGEGAAPVSLISPPASRHA